MLLVVFGLAWYMYTASGVPFNTIVSIGDRLYHGLAEFFKPGAQFFDPGTRDPTMLLAMGLTPTKGMLQSEVNRIIQWVAQLFIVVGVIGLVFNLRKTKFQPVYIAMTLASALLLLMCIILPYFAGFLNMPRIYHITLFFLAPFCVLGGITILRWLFRLVPTRAFRTSRNPIYLNFVVMLVLIPYLLFNTGFVYEVSSDAPGSLSLAPDTFSHVITHKQDIMAAEWLSEMDSTAIVKGDDHACDILGSYGFFPWSQVVRFTPWNIETNDTAFIFLSRGNIVKDEIWVFHLTERERINYPVSLENTTLFQLHNKIYDNGSVIYALK